MNEAHVCRCWRCRPGIYPRPPENPECMDGSPTPYLTSLHPRHRPTPAWGRPERLGLVKGSMAVYLNGVDVHEYNWGAVEVLYGDPGWIVYEELGVPHPVYDPGAPGARLWTQCGCGSGQACLHVAFGLVSTERITEADAVWAKVRMVSQGVYVTEQDRR